MYAQSLGARDALVGEPLPPRRRRPARQGTPGAGHLTSQSCVARLTWSLVLEADLSQLSSQSSEPMGRQPNCRGSLVPAWNWVRCPSFRQRCEETTPCGHATMGTDLARALSLQIGIQTDQLMSVGPAASLPSPSSLETPYTGDSDQIMAETGLNFASLTVDDLAGECLQARALKNLAAEKSLFPSHHPVVADHQRGRFIARDARKLDRVRFALLSLL